MTKPHIDIHNDGIDTYDCSFLNSYKGFAAALAVLITEAYKSRQHDRREPEKKAKLFNEWEMFTSNDGESIESYYHHFLKLMNDLKRNKHFPEKIGSNLKFLNNLQPEWTRHVTIVHQTKDLHTADYTLLYDFLKYNQKEVDELKAKRLAKTQDPLALMENSNNPYTFPVLNQDQPSFNQNYMQQPMPNPKDIIDPTTAMNMALALMAKAFKLNYSTPTNNNQRISSNPRNANQNGNGNLVESRTEGNATRNNGNQIRCYNCRGVGHFARNYTVRPRRRDAAYLQTQLLIVEKEEAGIQLQAKEFDLMVAAANLDEIEEVNANYILMANLQQALTSGTQIDKAPIYDSDGSAEVHNYEDCYDNEIFNMFTQEEKYIELLEPIPESHQVPQNDNNVISEKKKLKSDFKIREEELLDKQIQLEKRIKELDTILVKTGQSIQTIHMLSPKPDLFYHTEQKMALGYQNHFYLKQAQKNQPSLYNGKMLLKKHDPPVVHDSEETLQLAQESRPKMKQLNKEIKPANYTKINHLPRVFVSQTAKSREELYFSSASKTANVSTSISIPNEEFLYDTTPSVACKFLNEEAAKFVGDFKSLAKEADESLPKHKALELEIERLLRAVFSQDIMSVMQNNSVVDTSNLQTELEHNTKTRRPPPRSNTKNDRVPSVSKSSRSKNKGVEVEEHHGNLLLSKNKKHMSSACNNIKLDSHNVISKVVCAMCKQCLISVNHDVIQICLWCVDLGCSKHMTKNLKLLINFIWKFMGTVRFGNDHVAKIMGFSDLQWGNILITRAYFAEGLGHNLFSVGQFCDSDLEVTFRRNTCFVQYLKGVDLLKGYCTTNIYTINLHDMACTSPICLMAHASSTKSWLWYQRLSQLNFDTTNDLAKNDLVSGLLKFKYHKEHLCSSCEQGKSKRASYPLKPVSISRQRLHILHMDLCGPMRIASINGKRYVLVIVDDYSCYTWVHFLRTTDEAPEVIKTFLKRITVLLQSPVIIIRTDNDTKFKNQVLKEYFDSVGISHQVSSVRTPQQNGIVERRNRTLVEAARTMLIFSRAPLFLWAEAIATACFTQNRSIIHHRFNKTPYELINGRKPDIFFLHVFGALYYPKNDLEDIGKLGAKGDIGFFIGYSADSCELDLLFEAMYDDFIGGQLPAAQRTVLTALAQQNHFFKGTIDPMLFIRRFHDNILVYQAKPTEKHLKEVKRIFRYLQGTVNTSRWYTKDSGFKLTGFSDADYAGCKDTFKSTSGGAQFLGEKLVSWSSKKQDCTTLSTAEAEYVSLSTCCAQVLWMRTQLTNYGFHFHKIQIYCDSKLAIAISCNPVQHSRTKHIAVRYHFIKEHLEKGTIELYFVMTDYQLADIFTKALPTDLFNYLVRRLSMRSLSPQELDRLTNSQ
uniref:Retrovirus-related Pol polyprotein from transposon TNT 1-94 n=1 Tax=Tanacetum cinerariifolium TaxID=118510 RepID=A0A699GK08_TANCI|nr:retrovirus-related Pol polyprotein from transposon TNT 1-94 [Tanacetum cinerariifolium]